MHIGTYRLVAGRPAVMGILNVTPDSFSDGGLLWAEGPDCRRRRTALVLRRAEQMAREGADILDVGGESTRPGSKPVSATEEQDRILPVIEALRRESDLPISVDTSKAAVMTQAAAAGAAMINDTRALRQPGALSAAAASRLPVCLMHMHGTPADMQDKPEYRDPVGEIARWLTQRAQAVGQAGIGAKKIVLDPGFGFGKTPEHNLALLGRLPELVRLGYPILVGISRKSTLGAITGRGAGERLHASVAAAMYAAAKGAAIVRVHDVGPTLDALKVWRAAEDFAGGPCGTA